MLAKPLPTWIVSKPSEEYTYKDEKAFDVAVEALCKMVLKKFRIQVKYNS